MPAVIVCTQTYIQVEDKHVQELQQEVEMKNECMTRKDREIAQQGGRIQKLQDELEVCKDHNKFSALSEGYVGSTSERNPTEGGAAK